MSPLSAIIPPGMVDRGDVGTPDRGDEGYTQRLDIGESGDGESEAQWPQGPVSEQADGADHDQKPAGLRRARVIARPAPVFPETGSSRYQIGRKGSEEPEHFRAECRAVQHERPDEERGIQRSIGPAVEARAIDRTLIKQYGDLAIDPVCHGEEEEEPEEDCVLFQPGKPDEDE
ncbi:MAG: hypothetical protein O2971_20145 [Proteobacteria bacterium]|nr:hypothetical protein [Pseudomonadota bacterium]